VTIPDGVTTIGNMAFTNCYGLTNVTIGNGVTTIGLGAFWNCSCLTTLTLGNSVTRIGQSAFWDCLDLTSVIIPKSVISIGEGAFGLCTSLGAAYFQGNAPVLDSGFVKTFGGYGYGTIIYYLPGTTGWTPLYGGFRTALWFQPTPLILGSGYGSGATTNGFGFTISWATNLSVVVEACTDLANPFWTPVTTNALVNGTNYFSDPDWTNYPSHFYRLRSP
jgi:hypothetical protein